ncbi:MAG: alpha/beta hydrolase [Burkholderiaceae bacterium]
MPPPSSAKPAAPQLLLLHGAGLGKWIWESVIPLLEVPAVALDLPGRNNRIDPSKVTLADCIEFVAGKTTERSIIVGHSLSAEIALGVASANPRGVAALVLVGGAVPESGKSFISLLPLAQRIFLHTLLRLGRRGVQLPASWARAQYCSDLDEPTCKMVLERMVPEIPRLYLDDVDWAALPAGLPRWYVRLLNDQSVGLAQQEEAIRRIRATSVESLQTGHLPMLVRPRDTALVLNRIAATVASPVESPR